MKRLEIEVPLLMFEPHNAIYEVEPESDPGYEIGRMLFYLYQQGVRTELALMRMLTPRVPVTDH